MLWLVRHGESVANAGGITSDYVAVALTARGHKQAAMIAAACPETPARVVVSPYLRANQTARPFLARHPGVVVREMAIQEFTYLAASRVRDTDQDARRPLADAYWARMDPGYCDGDGAESFAGLVGRVRDFLEIASGWQGLTVAFTHEQFIRAVVCSTVLGRLAPSEEGMRAFFAIRAAYAVPNGGVVRLQFRGDQWWTSGVDRSHLTPSRLKEDRMSDLDALQQFCDLRHFEGWDGHVAAEHVEAAEASVSRLASDLIALGPDPTEEAARGLVDDCVRRFNDLDDGWICTIERENIGDVVWQAIDLAGFEGDEDWLDERDW